MSTKAQPAVNVKAEVQVKFPHYRLYRSTYEGKGLHATWHCALHRRDFRAKASSLSCPGNIGCPDCVEEQALRKRKRLRADPDLEKHLALIRQICSEDFVRTYLLYCDGVKLEEIGAAFGISIQEVEGRLRRIAAILLSKAAQQTTEST